MLQRKKTCFTFYKILESHAGLAKKSQRSISTEEGIKALITNPDPDKYKSYPDGGFLDGKVPVDPWKNPYIFVNNDGDVDMISLGADGKEGGSKENADITFTSCKK